MAASKALATLAGLLRGRPRPAATEHAPAPPILLCLYTCEADREHHRELEQTELMHRVRADRRIRVLEVYADAALRAARLEGDRLTLPCPETYGGLSLKTWHLMDAATRLSPEFSFLLKLDVTLAGYARKRQRKPADLLARLTPAHALAALEDPAFYAQPYNGLVSQQASREGFEAWTRTKGLACDFARVFPDGGPTPPYFLGKFYALRRDLCDYIAREGRAMALEHRDWLGGSEDIMIGRLHARWRDAQPLA